MSRAKEKPDLADSPSPAAASSSPARDAARQLADLSPLPVIVHRDGIVLFSNEASCEVFGGSCEDHLGRQVIDFVHEKDRPAVIARMAELKQSGSSPSALETLVRMDGSSFEARVHATLTLWEGEEAIQLIVEDISAERERQQRLFESEQRLRDLMQHSPLGIHFYHLNDRDELIFEAANPAADMILGVEHAAFAGLTMLEAFPALAETEVPKRYRRAIERNEPWRSEHLSYEHDQIMGAFEVHAFRTGPGRLAVFFQNILDRKQQQEKVARSQQRLKRFMDASEDLVVILDHELRLLEFNQTFSELMPDPDTASSLIGLPLSELYPTLREQGRLQSYKRVLETGEAVFSPGITGAGPLRGRRFDIQVFRMGEELGVLARDVTDQARTLAALAESEQQLSLALSGANMASWVWLIDQDTIHYDERWADILGHAPGETTGSSQQWRERIHPDDLPAIEALVAEHLEGKSAYYEAEYRVRHHKGHDIWIMDRGQVVERGSEDQPLRAAGTYLDISDRRQGQQERERLQRRLEETFERMPLLALTLDLEGRIIRHNQRLAQVTGHGESSLVGLDWFDAFLPLEQREQIRQIFLATVEEGRFPEHYENPILCVDGSQRTIRWSNSVSRTLDGSIESVTSFGEDVSEARQTEMRMRQLAAAIEQSADVVFITDTEGRIEYSNPAFTQVTGFTPEEALGQTPGQLLEQQPGSGDLEDIYSTLRTGESWSGTLLSRHKDGGEGISEVVISPIQDDRGEVIRYVSVQRDISKERELEDQLHHSQKMEAIGNLAGGIAHDFNNLLTAIIGQVELARFGLDENEAMNKDLAEIGATAERAAALTRQLLTFARKQVTRPVVMNLNEIIEQARRLLERTIGEHIELAFELEPELWNIHFDPTQSEQILINLCVNSRDAMPDGGRLMIHTANIPADTAGEQDRVLFEVADTGVGMSSEVAERVFEPFFTTKETGRGTGLGLATVFGIVKQHEGDIQLQTATGQGARFRIFLPARHSQRDASESRERSAEQLRGTESLLLVEDEELVRDVTVNSLRRFGYRVEAVHSGPEAMGLLTSGKVNPDLMITDMVMPYQRGDELYRELREKGHSFPVLFISGYSEEGERIRELAGEKAPLLKKPFRPLELLHAVRELLDS